MQALQVAWREARESYQREHVTPYFYEHRERFRVIHVTDAEDHGDLRWTVDTPEDLDFVRAVYARFAGRGDFGWREVLALIQREPALAAINAHVAQKGFREAESTGSQEGSAGE